MMHKTEIWQIRGIEYAHSDSNPIILSGTEEQVRRIWTQDGYSKADVFGLYRVTFEMVEGVDTITKSLI